MTTGNRARDFGVGDGNGKPATAADIGLRRDESHDARKMRDAEQVSHGTISRAIKGLVDRGAKPMFAMLRLGDMESQRLRR